MGFNQTLNLSVILFTILIISSSSPAACNDIVSTTKASDLASTPSAAAYRVLHIKNTTPFVINAKESDHKKRKARKMKSERRKTKRNNNNNNNNIKAAGRPFSVMLPKGYVPPSGSSPCHNDKPDSWAPLFCGFSAAKKP